MIKPPSPKGQAQVAPGTVETWLINTHSPSPSINKEEGSETEAFDTSEISTNLQHSNEESKSSLVDSTSGISILKAQESSTDIGMKNRESKQSIKRRKKKTVVPNKKSKNNYLKSRTSKVRIAESQTKANIIDEEDVLCNLLGPNRAGKQLKSSVSLNELRCLSISFSLS